jgi:ubiquitin thioesterase CYLD
MTGIELEDYRVGCGDGCLPGSRKPLFSCSEGRGVFCPTCELSPDIRAPDPPLEEETPTPASRPSQLFETGSMVEVKGFGFGVVQWVGKMAGTNTAGIELEEFSNRGGDGTPEGGAKALFPCQPGHCVFSPVQELVPDSRFMITEATNPLEDIALETIIEKQPIPRLSTYCGTDKKKGIQGEHNSCYIDATLFGLFALSSEFDSLLTPGRSGGPDQRGPGSSLGKTISTILLTKIVNPLRKRGVVRCEPVLELREQLDTLGKITGLLQDEKDPEEFLNLLFKHALSASPFVSIQRPQGEEEEFFIQLFMEPDPSLPLPTIGHLLSRMFSEQSIKFSQIPGKLLIQVPRYGKQFKTFQRIVPDKMLDINSLCNNSCRKLRKHRELNAHLKLLSVVCIETSHYVCFCHHDDHWVFMDSMADRVDDRFNIPSCEDCTADLEEWVYGDKLKKNKSQKKEKNVPELVRRFTQDIYMCVYVEDSTAV